MIPAITDFRARGTIMGPAGLTAVFGMGTGVAPPVWSPGRRPGGGVGPQVAWSRCPMQSSGGVAGGGGRGHTGGVVSDRHRPGSRLGSVPFKCGLAWGHLTHARARGCVRLGGEAAPGRGGQAARLLGPVGCGPRGPCTPGLSTWWSPRSLQYMRTRKPGLGGGFALRCLQRLSGPDLATLRCR